LCPLEYRGCATPGGWVTPKKTCIFRGFGAQKTISSYSFDQIVLIFGYIVDPQTGAHMQGIENT